MLLNELLNIKYPIIQGGMANISDGKFAACVSNAGGLGIIACGSYTAGKVEEEILICKSLTDKPFGVNVMLMSPYAKDVIEVICKMQVPVVTTGAGNPGPYIPALKEAGCKVFPVIASVTHAVRLSRYDIDGLIVEGTESGGHIGEATTMALVPQVVNAVDLPVIAAGGIASGKQFNAAIALGAIGVQVGTVMLASLECPIHENYKNAIIAAKDSDTCVTGRSVGLPVRILKNEMAKKYIDLEKQVTDKMELEEITIGALRKAVIDGDVVNGSLMSGQVAGMISSIKSVGEILDGIMMESKIEFERMKNIL